MFSMALVNKLTHHFNSRAAARTLSYLSIHCFVAIAYVYGLHTHSSLASCVAVICLMALYTLAQPHPSRLLSLTLVNTLLLFLSSYWLIYPLQDMIQIHPVVGALSILIAAGLISTLLTIPVLMYHRRLPWTIAPISCSFFCIFGEYLRQQTIIATPWMNVSNLAFNIPILNNALPIGGGILTGYLLLRLAETIVTVLRGQIDKDGRQVFAIYALLAMSSVYMSCVTWFNTSTNSNQSLLTVNLLQGNINPLEKRDNYLNWEEQAHLIHQQHPRNLNILSEGVLSIDKESLPLHKFRTYSFLKNSIIGLNYVDGKKYQSMLIGVNKVHGRYTKQHYVPFGEYLPLQSMFSWYTDFFDDKRTPTTDNNNTIISYGRFHLYPMICYDLFFEPNTRKLINNADAIIVIAENTWFHDSMMQKSFVRAAQLRALEYRLPILLVMNRGYTAHISADGRIVEQLPYDTQQVLHTTVAKRIRTTNALMYLKDYQVLIGILLLEIIGSVVILRLSNQVKQRAQS